MLDEFKHVSICYDTVVIYTNILWERSTRTKMFDIRNTKEKYMIS